MVIKLSVKAWWLRRIAERSWRGPEPSLELQALPAGSWSALLAILGSHTALPSHEHNFNLSLGVGLCFMVVQWAYSKQEAWVDLPFFLT